MRIVFALFCMMVFGFASDVTATPIDDLSSTDQGIRDKAAAELQTTYKEVPQNKWEPIINKIEKGQTKVQVFNLLRPFNSTSQGGAAGGGSYSESYRLDNDWMLTCWYEEKGDILIDRKLDQSIKYVWVDPPKDFTGKWITYFVNGQKSDEINYRHGQYIGEFGSYHANGTKSVVQHYDETGANGEEFDYHPSGHLACTGRYKDGKQAGKWMWYDDDGNITSTREEAGVYQYNVTFSEPDIKTPHGILFCNGVSLPMAFEQVITPLGEFVGVKNGGVGEWQPVEKGSTTVGRTTVDPSTEAYVAGSFEHPPKDIGSEWFYLVKRGLWVNPTKWYEVPTEPQSGKVK